MALLDAAQGYWFARFLDSAHDGTVWVIADADYELYTWAKGLDGGYPNLATVTWPA